jgi:hypothetical protein
LKQGINAIESLKKSDGEFGYIGNLFEEIAINESN